MPCPGDDDDEAYDSDLPIHDLKSSGEELAAITVPQAGGEEDSSGAPSGRASSAGAELDKEPSKERVQQEPSAESQGQASAAGVGGKGQAQEEEEEEEEAQSVEDEEIPEEASQASLRSGADQQQQQRQQGTGPVRQVSGEVNEEASSLFRPRNAATPASGVQRQPSAELSAEPSTTRPAALDLRAAIEETLASMGDDDIDYEGTDEPTPPVGRASILESLADNMEDSLFSPSVGPRTSITSLRGEAQSQQPGGAASPLDAQKSGGGASDAYDDDFELPSPMAAPAVELSPSEEEMVEEEEEEREEEEEEQGEQEAASVGKDKSSSDASLDLGEDVSIEFDDIGCAQHAAWSGQREAGKGAGRRLSRYV